MSKKTHTNETVSASDQRRALPQPPTAFVGREEELRELVEMLGNESCRLVTLLGPGGAGKTRLAIEAARRWADESGIEAAFVPLESAAGPEAIAPEIAGALGIRGIGSEEPATQLLRVLGKRELLLVLDNFEGVIEGAGLVADLLEGAPGLTLLVTSREALNLSSEWRYAVRGLPVPPVDAPAEVAVQSAAVQLFAERARRVDPAFALADNVAEASRISRLVDGVPLAIELAASWTASLTCSEIADEISARINFLATNRRDVPERQRSVQAVFDQAWGRLSPEEQEVFARLSVFHGGFEREAAGEIAGATLPMLTSFVDRSLIWKDADGRFRVHDLLSQCAREHLRAGDGMTSTMVDDLDEVRDSHADYYVRLASGLLDDVIGGDHIGAIKTLGRDYDNLIAAVERAVARRRLDGLRDALHVLSAFNQFTARYGDGVRQREPLLREIAKWPQDADTNYLEASVLNDLAWLYVRVGRIEDAKQAGERALAIYDEVGPLPRGSSTDPIMVLAVAALVHGEYARAGELSAQALVRAEAVNAVENIPYAHFGLCEAALGEGQYEAARDHGLRALKTAQAIGDHYFMAYVLNQVGAALAAMGETAEARRRFEESYAIRHEFGDPEGMAVALNHLGDLALKEGDYTQALRIFEESRTLYRDLDDIGGRATTLRGLGEACTGLGRYTEAAAYLRQALADAASIRFASALASLASASADLLADTGREEAAAKVRTRGGDTDIDALATAIDVELASIEPHAGRGDGSLVEPLSEREIEVLRCIADGLSNREIAERLVVSLGTVKAHTHNIYGKLGAENRVQALARAREAGVLGD